MFLQGLAASLGYGAASEIIRRTASPGAEGPQQSVMMTEANITRLVSKLSQMRGAALKLGQFLSIQGEYPLVSARKLFVNGRQIRMSCRPMSTKYSGASKTVRTTCPIGKWRSVLGSSTLFFPRSLNPQQVLTGSLGPDWARAFTTFDRVPFAAASIGQVHTATLAADVSPTGAAARVAVKIQFPNIANSIASDLGYISLLLTAGRLLPKGLFLERTMQVGVSAPGTS